MKTRRAEVHGQIGRATLQSSSAQLFLLNDLVNQMLIEHLDPAAWRAKPSASARIRTIAAIFTHMHNVRCKWIRLTAPHLKIPRQLKRTQCTPRQASAALAESAAGCAEMLAGTLRGDSQVKQFRRDGWARPWTVGPEMLCYMLCHEAHHRGQVCMLAHQFGLRLPSTLTSGMWNWEKLSKQTGFALRSGYSS